MTGDGDRSAARERWADEVTCVGCGRKRNELIRNALFSSLPDAHGVDDLPKTDIERTLVAETSAAANEVLQGQGLPGSPISDARVHVLTDAEFEATIGRGCRGKCAYGHVYLRRQDDLTNFAHELTHEIAHLISFLAIRVTAETRPDGHRDLQILPRRSGLSLYGLDPAEEDPLFNGLNEAVTEIIAHEIRAALAVSSKILSADGCQQLIKTWVYLPQIKLIWHLLDRLQAAGGDSDPGRELLQDYFAGTSRFLNRLYAADPGALRLLRTMGTRASDAFGAADKLGCPEIMDDIRRFYGRKPDPQPPK